MRKGARGINNAMCNECGLVSVSYVSQAREMSTRSKKVVDARSRGGRSWMFGLKF